jgi:hypothetical protein
MRPLCVLFAMLISGGSALAQQPAPAELIDHLVANAQLYAETLPSLAATETIDSEGSYLIFHRRVRATADFRVLRQPNASFEESRQITEADGKPVAPGAHVALPSTLFGGFSRFQELFFTPAHRLCYRFTLLPGAGPDGAQQIAIAELPGTVPGCVPRGITGLARVDPETRHVVYLERTVPGEIALKNRLAPFAWVALAPARIGDRTFWLPTTVFGAFVNGKVKGSFEAHYSGYHRFTSSVTILPGVTEVDSTPATGPPPR